MTTISRVVVYSGIVKQSEGEEQAGQKRFFVDVHDTEGGICGVWDGDTAEAARDAAREWDAPVIDTTIN